MVVDNQWSNPKENEDVDFFNANKSALASN